MSLARDIIALIDKFYFEWIARFVPRQTFRYGVCGVATYFVFDPVLYFIIYHYVVAKRMVEVADWLIISPEIASLIVVFPITFFVGFWLNRNVTFRESPLATPTQLVRYALSIVGSLLLNYLLMKLFVEGLGLWATPSKVLVSLVCAVYSYLAAKYFTFRDAVNE